MTSASSRDTVVRSSRRVTIPEDTNAANGAGIDRGSAGV